MKYYAIMLTETDGDVEIREVTKEEAFDLDAELCHEVTIIYGTVIKQEGTPIGNACWPR